MQKVYHELTYRDLIGWDAPEEEIARFSTFFPNGGTELGEVAESPVEWYFLLIMLRSPETVLEESCEEVADLMGLLPAGCPVADSCLIGLFFEDPIAYAPDVKMAIKRVIRDHCKVVGSTSYHYLKSLMFLAETAELVGRQGYPDFDLPEICYKLTTHYFSMTRALGQNLAHLL